MAAHGGGLNPSQSPFIYIYIWKLEPEIPQSDAQLAQKLDPSLHPTRKESAAAAEDTNRTSLVCPLWSFVALGFHRCRMEGM